jgi:prepilin-type N-terminal cleavage/methylation domain-containing protein
MEEKGFTKQLCFGGFTLAEVLITLAIIGVVAALTIPAVARNYQKSQTIIKLKKTYSALANTTNLAMVDYGPIEEWILPESNKNKSVNFANTYLIPYLKVIKNCENKTDEECEFKYSYLNKSISMPMGSSYARFYLNDGTLLAVMSVLDTTNHLAYAMVYIDINGQKSPNTNGKDMFYYIYCINEPGCKGKFVPYKFDEERITLKTNYCSKQNSGWGCAALIMKDGWQIKDDYPGIKLKRRYL